MGLLFLWNTRHHRFQVLDETDRHPDSTKQGESLAVNMYILSKYVWGAWSGMMTYYGKSTILDGTSTWGRRSTWHSVGASVGPLHPVQGRRVVVDGWNVMIRASPLYR